MSHSKELFMNQRQTLGNHLDKALERYYKYQNADKNQINQIQGQKQKWK